jgi:NAD(P)-dependent dehydrogenase (short-subunit alcohol dehydrogenase family)
VKVLVTGAAGGIGAAIVRLAVARGHAVLAHDLTSAGTLPSQLAEVEQICGDLTDSSALHELASASEAFGVEAAVLTHGIEGSGSIAELTDERVRRILAINAGTVPAIFDALEPCLAVRHGRFVVITSQAALRAEPDHVAYCAAKWAAHAWLESRARLAGDEVSVRIVCPGRTTTPLLHGALEGAAAGRGETLEKYTSDVLALIPLGRFAEPDEIAGACLYLAEAGRRPTGLPVTGGEVPY